MEIGDEPFFPVSGMVPGLDTQRFLLIPGALRLDVSMDGSVPLVHGDGWHAPPKNGSLISLHTLSDVEKGVYKFQPTTAT